ncbi:hypothetical protein [Telluria aromaticivorans]|uniref:Uncharacterized protein n=1 Tax=Telluria aromaticivorans TaxID=2725995 RepID=A0A7Y2K2I1_9BURK|nr:hypothetical protein [Telluria aromaticivorans]NNG25387.1 hypothetical protein [Telluria aromaticivorans]
MKSISSLFARARCLPMEAGQSGQACIIRMTVDAASVTNLRQLAMRVCGDALEFMRIAMCGGSARIQVWMCVRRPVAALLREAVARQMPDARLGQAGGLPGVRL